MCRVGVICLIEGLNESDRLGLVRIPAECEGRGEPAETSLNGDFGDMVFEKASKTLKRSLSEVVCTTAMAVIAEKNSYITSCFLVRFFRCALKTYDHLRAY